MSSPSPWDPSPSRVQTSLADAGHKALAAFALAPDRIHLNHGSFGAVPIAVRETQDRIRAHIEADFTSFYREELPAAMRFMAAKVAARFGGAGEDWVFCENATTAINGVIASFPLAPDDEIVTTSHVYGAVLRTMRIMAGRRGAKLVVAELPAMLEHDDQVVDAITATFTARTKLLIVDHITSATATIFPVARIASLAKGAGIAVLVDGAHAPGQIPLDVPAIGADWYTGNAHKWLFAPKGCGILWTTPARQAMTLPAVLSHGSESSYTAAFDWVGTRDLSAWLSFEAAAQAFDSFGGSALMARNRQLAAQGAAILCEGLGTRCAAPSPMRAAMATIQLKQTMEDLSVAAAFQRALAEKAKIIAPFSNFAGGLVFRVSANLYNEIDDYRRCLAACLELRDGAFRAQFG